MGNLWSQSFPPKPVFTENECPDLVGKVFIVTGGASGVGRELVNILYQKNATVYVAARSEEKSLDTIKWCKTQHPNSTGNAVFLHLDLGDLAGTKKSADEFLAKETRLDVLWNNAGVMVPPEGSTTAQGHELQLGTNCLGPFLFTRYLLPLLTKTASTSAPGSVRVAWAGSLVIDTNSPSGGIDIENIKWDKKSGNQQDKYAQSKTGNMFLASEFAKRTKDDPVTHVAFNPGNLKSPLQRHLSPVLMFVMQAMLHDPKYGAYTELFSGLSPDISLKESGSYVIPWGRKYTPRPDLLSAMQSKEEGGAGTAAAFWEWCEAETSTFYKLP